MKLRRPTAPPNPISLVSMIDVLMIMLIFFMVTSTFLDLRMVPVAERAAAPAAAPGMPGGTFLIRLGPDGVARVQGRPLDAGALVVLLSARMAQAPDTSVLVLPSGQADAQALVTLLDTVTRAGVTRLRLLRLEAAP
ncbi:biopolymer transporter ExbD [Paracoccaceae bacterium Fryx2]|nr:biopolymer transporter ExbD [Paracoccaceae bacterium Fryx2]